jgi:hypothetical protein
MNTHHIPTRTAIARPAVVGIATGLAAFALAFAGPASADHTLLDKTINVSDCGPAGQTCRVTPTFTFFAPDEHVTAEFIAGGDGCSSIVAHIVIDGNTYPGSKVGPNQSDGGHELQVKPGFHKIGVLTDGVDGGCNTGHLASYSGRLLVDNVED